MNRLLILSALFPLLLLLGCSKEEEENTKNISATVHVYNSQTGEPVEVGVTLLWFGSGGTGPNFEEKGTSLTNAQGNASKSFNYSEGSKYESGSFRIRVMRDGYLAYQGTISGSMIGTMLYLSSNSENHFEVALDPHYPFSVTAINTSCTSPTDSLWIEVPGLGDLYSGQSYKRSAYGCADTLLPGQLPYGGYKYWKVHDTSFIDFQIITKKSGVINSYTESFNLTADDFTPIVIEY